MIAKTALFCGGNAGKEQLAVRHGGKDRVDIGLARAVVPHRAADQNQIADLYLRLKCAAATDADHVFHAKIVQFFDGDSGGSPTDAGRHREHGYAVVTANKASIFPIVGKLPNIGQKRFDAVEPRGIARQQRADRAVILIQTDMRL